MAGEPGLWTLFWLFGRLSLLAVGGANATVPEMHRVIVDEGGWMDAATFAQLYALSAASPGPNILFVAVLGLRLAGAAGAVVSLAGILLPATLLAWGVAGLTQRLAGASWLRALQGGLVPVAIGLTLATGLLTAVAAADGAGAAGWPLAAVTVAATAFVWRARFSPLWVLLAGGVAGLLLG